MDDAAFETEVGGVMARFFVPRQNIHEQHAVLAGAELEHLRRVLRLEPGDSVNLFDDTGSEHEAVIRALGADRAELDIVRSVQSQRESSLALTLALGLTKGEKMDFVVEKATELGVQAILPFVSRYAVPKFDDDKIAKRTERWRKIAVSAAKQCGRSRMPEIVPLQSFRALVNQPSTGTLKLLFWEKEAEQSLTHVHITQAAARALLLVIGPEGGFSSEEADSAREHGFLSVRLGPRTLRAETAAVTAVSLAQFLWGDLS
jgi:16S rRNA (uracil1498-N3)-methyltransferase